MTTKYFVTETGAYVGAFDGAAAPAGSTEVPIAPADARQIWDFQAQTWGPVPVEVPQEIHAAQGRLALLHAGLLDAAEAALAAMPGDAGRAARIEWEYRTTWRRDHNLILVMAAALGLSDEQVDALFVAAAAL